MTDAVTSLSSRNKRTDAVTSLSSRNKRFSLFLVAAIYSSCFDLAFETKRKVISRHQDSFDVLSLKNCCRQNSWLNFIFNLSVCNSVLQHLEKKYCKWQYISYICDNINIRTVDFTLGTIFVISNEILWFTYLKKWTTRRDDKKEVTHQSCVRASYPLSTTLFLHVHNFNSLFLSVPLFF